MNKFFLLLSLLSLLSMEACKKNHDYVANNTATMNVINGIIQKNVYVRMNGSISNSGANGTNSSQYRVSYGRNILYYAEANNTPVDILNSVDSSILVSKNCDLKKGGIYSLLLAGIAPNAEAVLIDDSNIPIVDLSKTPSDADSVINVRFINLSPDISNIDVRVQGSTTNEVNGLVFKGASSWKSYPAKSVNSKYVFEFVENGLVRRTASLFITPKFNQFKNVALVLTGMKTPAPGMPSLNVATMNYFQ
jgi:hypothetical protein